MIATNRATYCRLCWAAAELHGHATRYLARLGIDEPLTWSPPANCCDCLGLPGRDPDDIDLQAVGQLVIAEGLPAGTVADRVGTSTGHIRLALERVPRPPRQWCPTGDTPAAWRRHQRARAVLTREFFEREYIQAGKRLSQLAAETGYNRAILARYARQAGIRLRKGAGAITIDRDWLHEQYVLGKRSTASIGAELGASDETIARSLRQHGLPVRPSGVHSRPEMLARLPAGTPRDIRRAAEGGLKGWHRLRRFQDAMTFPTIEAAATGLGAHQSALVHQFRRLERDIGAKLYDPCTPRRPMRPTPRGAALLKAMSRPDIQGPAIGQHPAGVPGAAGPLAAAPPFAGLRHRGPTGIADHVPGTAPARTRDGDHC